MNEEPAIAKDERPRPYALWKVLIVSWLACVLAMVCIHAGRYSLLPLSWSFADRCVSFGLPFGTLFFVVLIGPVQAVIFWIVCATKAPRQIARGIAFLPLLFLAWTTVGDCFQWRHASCQPALLERITRMPYPQGATLIAWGHGFGFKDQRHVWMFESTPEQFDKIRASKPWQRSEELPGQILDQMHCAFPASSSWTVAEAYTWETEESARDGFFGPSWLLVDKEHTHWCVWWDAI